LTAQPEEPTATPEPTEIGHRERIALRKIGDQPGFQWYEWEAIGNEKTRDVLMTGCVVTRTYQRGPRKGQPVYDGLKQRVVVTGAEIEAERTRYEAETGKCAECMGSARVVAGWDHITGAAYRPCRVCKATGKVHDEGRCAAHREGE